MSTRGSRASGPLLCSILSLFPTATTTTSFYAPHPPRTIDIQSSSNMTPAEEGTRRGGSGEVVKISKFADTALGVLQEAVNAAGGVAGDIGVPGLSSAFSVLSIILQKIKVRALLPFVRTMPGLIPAQSARTNKDDAEKLTTEIETLAELFREVAAVTNTSKPCPENIKGAITGVISYVPAIPYTSRIHLITGVGAGKILRRMRNALRSSRGTAASYAAPMTRKRSTHWVTGLPSQSPRFR